MHRVSRSAVDRAISVVVPIARWECSGCGRTWRRISASRLAARLDLLRDFGVPILIIAILVVVLFVQFSKAF